MTSLRRKQIHLKILFFKKHLFCCFFPTDPNLLAVDRAVGAKGAVLDEAELVHYL